MLAVATAAGRDTPWARDWALSVGLPLERLPARPGRVLASALSANDSKRYVRPKTAAYLPDGSVWSNRYGDGEASVKLPNGGVVVFKSNDQGREKYQGDWFDLVWLDEEHDYDVFEECEGRVSRVPGGYGHIVLTMSPLKGFTWVYAKFLEARAETYEVHNLDALENPYTNLEKMRRWLNRLSASRRAARKAGQFSALEGAVYDLVRELHIVPSQALPAEWRRFRGIDFGVRHPFCCLWFALDPQDDVLHCYREFYVTERTTKQNGQEINRLNGPDRIEWTVADPADLNARMTLAGECGIATLPAKKAIVEGVGSVQDRLRLDAAGRTHLVIHDCCVNTIREFGAYRYPEGNKKDIPIDADNHAMDVVRYVCHQLRSGSVSFGVTTG